MQKHTQYNPASKLNAVLEFLASGKTYHEFCTATGINRRTLAAWVGDYKKNGQSMATGGRKSNLAALENSFLYSAPRRDKDIQSA